jgi:ribose transport system substrate-binding protein
MNSTLRNTREEMVPRQDGREPKRSRYLVESVLRACDLLQAFAAEGELLSLRELAARTGLSKTTAFRLLRTLEERGLVRSAGDRRFQLSIKPLRRARCRIGYAALGAEFALSREVTESLVQAADAEGVDLFVVDNKNSTRAAMANADLLIKQRVDLVIEHQPDEHVAAMLSSRFLDAGLPFIAVNVPHPGATFFGANNYLAGLLAGQHLGRWVRQHWKGGPQEVILIGRSRAGALINSRIAGAQRGLQEILPDVGEARLVYLDSPDGRFGTGLEVTRKHLRRSRADRVLVAVTGDQTALGVLRAFEEAGRLSCCAVIGQSGCLEARSELRRPGTRLLGSVAYFPETYGPGLIALALKILAGQPVPPAVFTRHQVLTPDNVNHFYPNDALRDLVGLERRPAAPTPHWITRPKAERMRPHRRDSE